jgi:hypothetical protein
MIIRQPKVEAKLLEGKSEREDRRKCNAWLKLE